MAQAFPTDNIHLGRDSEESLFCFRRCVQMRIGAAFQSGQPQTCLEAEFSVSKGDAHISSKLISLLFLIRETQSVREACSRMQISYSTAWNMLNTAENALGYPLLLRNKGGPSGTGSLLTEKGQELLSAYAQFESAAKENMEKLFDSYLRDIL